MKYNKPSLVALAQAADAIQSGQGVKGGMQWDLYSSQIPNPNNSVAAYEADE
jgi:hypothetical protein